MMPSDENKGFVIELIAFSSLSLISAQIIRVDSEAILERKQDMDVLVSEIYGLSCSWKSSVIPEHDWSKIRQVDFQQLQREKSQLLNQMYACSCNHCPILLNHYSIIHRERMLKQQLADLAHSISDQNLELLPG
jgi:antiviral helicase SKI2